MSSKFFSDLPEEQKQAARRLLEAGIFRQPTPEERTWQDHPFHLAEAYCRKSIAEVCAELESKNTGEMEIYGVTLEPVTAPDEVKPTHPAVESTEPNHDVTMADSKPAGEKQETDDGVNPYLKQLRIPSQEELAAARLAAQRSAIDGATAAPIPVIPMRILAEPDFGKPFLEW